MNEYRLTRNHPYRNPNCFGFADLSARQGFYITADSAVEAEAIMSLDFPEDWESFTCHLCKEDVDV